MDRDRQTIEIALNKSLLTIMPLLVHVKSVSEKAQEFLFFEALWIHEVCSMAKLIQTPK